MENLNKINLEKTTVWSFPKRGNWKTHNSKFRGNFAPQLVRNIILRYSEEGDIVLDPMVGGGTTMIEAKILNRKGIGLDINPNAINITKKNLLFDGDYKYEPEVYVGDVRNLKGIHSNSVDLIITHPPYLNIIKYSGGSIKGDLSNISGIKKFCNQFEEGIKEFYRILKPNSYCAILIGDTRRGCHYVPLAFFIMKIFLKTGFILKEDIIKIQYNCKSTPFWKQNTDKYNFLMIMHEHLFVFRKPDEVENLERIRYSMNVEI